ncbi:hypothetical protein [Psychromicrobium lacuslunae]|uniref:hypothetical protein n=1 Tax=Psychromicrobium lacuslunae TaxID=1618207 RepID=UPI000698CDCE|nr:hypothetical protein [Psychromicrobium lacuslunae]
MKARAVAKASRMMVFRLALGLLGVLLIAFGLIGIPSQLNLGEMLGLLSWLAVALLLHDGVLVPLTQLSGAGLRRLSYGLRQSSAAVIRSALLIGAVQSLIVLPLLKAQQVAKQESVLEGDYLAALVVFWLVLAVVTAASVFMIEWRARIRDH